MTAIVAVPPISQAPVTALAMARAMSSLTAPAAGADAGAAPHGKAAHVALAHHATLSVEQRLDALAGQLKTHNDVTSLYARIDWDGIADKVGNDRVDAVRGEMTGYIASSAERIGRAFGDGLDIRPVGAGDTDNAGLAPGSLVVGNSTIVEEPSTYSVTTDKDGNLVGIKDGKVVKTWKITPSLATHGRSTSPKVLSDLQAVVAHGKDEAHGSAGLVKLTV